ncbi:acyl-CoA N-acyltransferase [Microdochium bolleyi]|uniref:Acyl-CoA N-acyltransferase n=1 Tax=Microdochium bolleyi TaxID=196109 RepID=A0A136JCT8_9PEZI|nr:acyl-CoA N-acyltransferase [Microdochium bolleyi]
MATQTHMTSAGTASSTQRTSEARKPTIALRDARYSDLPVIAHVMALAFWDDHIFGAIIHPHRDQFPLDSDLYWLRRARISFWDWHYKWLVAVAKGDDGRETVVGIAQWERMGEGAKALECAWFDPRNLLKPASSLAMSLHARLWPNRAADPANEDIIERCLPCLDDVWVGNRAESWYLSFLAVHPDFQGQGIGKDLVAWGLERAEDEGVVASVISAHGKNEFYKRCGFDEMYKAANVGPLAHTPGSDILWKWPSKR